jgi:hypothetical protein
VCKTFVMARKGKTGFCGGIEGLMAVRFGMASDVLWALMMLGLGRMAGAQTSVDLPSSKQLLLPVPGGAQRLNSLPMSLAVSPDGRWVVSLNAGMGRLSRGMRSRWR